MSRNSFSDTDFDERAGADGEAIMWEETHEVYSDVIMKLPDVGKDMGDHDAEQYISEAAKLMGLERTDRMKITPGPLNKCRVPTPPRELTIKFFRLEGFQQENKLVSEGKNTTFIVLEPVLKEAPSTMTNTLAQEFIRNPSKLWWNNSSLQLQTSIPYHHKLLLWARMMLISQEDKAMLLQADIFRGVLASIYHIPINPSLLAAFLTFWNTEGHTLVTTQGEIGYPLIAMHDAMGIPISGHLYEEYIPIESEISGIVRVLHTVYTDIWVLHQKGDSSSVTLQNWLDHFIGEDLGATVKTKAQMPSHFYADPEDPLLSRLDFRTLELQKCWSARFSSYRIFHQQGYGREIKAASMTSSHAPKKEKKNSAKTAAPVSIINKGNETGRSSGKWYSPYYFLLFHAGLIDCFYADPGVSTIGATLLPKKSQAIPKAKTNQASKPSSVSAATHLSQKNILVSNKKGNVTSDEKRITASPKLGTPTINPSVGEVSVEKRKETNALQKNRGKRSSPQPVREEGKTDLVKPDVEDKRLDVTSEQPEDHHDNSPVKKQCLGRPGDEQDLEAALSKAATLKSTIDRTINCYLTNVGDEFTKLKRNSDQNGMSKYGERTGIVVPQFADPGLRSMMGYIQTDLKRIHKWIAAPILDKVALSTRIGKILNSWRAMLRDKIPQEVQELINELEHLCENLNSKVEHAVPFSISQLRADEEQVKEQLSIGQKSHGSVMLGYNSLKGYGSVWRSLKDEVKQRKEEYLVKIKELNDALGIVRAKLSLEKEYEEKLNQLHSQYDEILNRASGVLSRFEETLAQGSSCLESINKAIEETGSLGDSELPIGLREQLKFVESCMMEGVEENDE
ncbi:hypothetical protein ACQ4PT_055752 [Festuca glaucescens]